MWNFAVRVVPLLLSLFIILPIAVAQDDDMEAQVQVSMASEPSFEFAETIVNIENEGLIMIGTLALPVSESPVPLFHGFKGERDELPIVNTEEAMFSRTARIFAERGIASLRIEFRGSGESEGLWEDTIFTGQISDAIAALDFAQTIDGVDPERIGILGLSQGGAVGASAAGQDAHVKSLVLWSAAANLASNFSNLLPLEVMQAGLALPDGEALPVTLPWGEETSMKRGFFEELFTVDPVAVITRYSGPMLVVVGSRDTTVYPMPQQGQIFLNYHEGEEALVVLDGDHIFEVVR
jgi:cephalosporin-C deacetylase-like acetyl esterase